MYFDEPARAPSCRWRPALRDRARVVRALVILLFWICARAAGRRRRPPPRSRCSEREARPRRRRGQGSGSRSSTALGSTNDEAHGRGRAGDPGGSGSWRASRRSGRGRRGRAWSSPPGNLARQPAARRRRAARASRRSSASSPASRCTPAVEQGDRADAGPRRAEMAERPAARRRQAGRHPAGSGARCRAAASLVVIGIGVNVAHHPADTALSGDVDLGARGSPVGVDALFAAPVGRHGVDAAALGRGRRLRRDPRATGSSGPAGSASHIVVAASRRASADGVFVDARRGRAFAPRRRRPYGSRRGRRRASWRTCDLQTAAGQRG